MRWQLDAKAAGFVDKFGLLAEEGGMPQIAGRILGFLMLHEGAFSLDQLAEELQISKTSASTNARLLEQKSILVRAPSPGDRKDYYELRTNQFEAFYTDALKRLRGVLGLVTSALNELSPEQQVSKRRLQEVQRFYAFLLESIEQDLERWRKLNESVQTQ